MELWQKTAVAIIIIGAAVGVVLVGGYLAGWMGTPYVSSIENSWGNVSSNEAELMTSVTIENPNPFNIKITSLHYTILLNNITVAEGWDSDVTLKGGTTVVDYVSNLNMSKIPEWWSSHLNQDEKTHIAFTYQVKASAGPIHRSKTITETYGTVDTDLLSTLQLDQPRNISVQIQGEDYCLLVASNFTASWGSITEETTIINATVELYNPHYNPVEVETFVYYFHMNNLTVGHGSISHAFNVPPYGTVSIDCDTIIDNSDLIEWFTSHIQNNETTHYEIGSGAKFTHRGKSYTIEPIHLEGDVTTDMLD